jgi:SAM-dependent methyltransferase
MACRPVHDIEHDLEYTIPPPGGPDSDFVFGAMTERSLALLQAGAGDVVLDLGCGMGQDALALAERAPGSLVLGLEPSNRMIRFGQGEQRRRGGGANPVCFVRAFGEALPLRSGSVDALLCKGALDHFMDPRLTMAEAARVLRPGGRAVVALANYDSLSCRLGRAWDRLRRRWNPAAEIPAHPFYEPPPDHLTRFGHAEIVALASPALSLRRVEGLSLLWGFGPWTRWLGTLPRPLAALLVNAAALAARVRPQWADVVVIQLLRR